MERLSLNNIHKIKPILESVIKDLNIEDKSSVDYIVKNMTITIGTGGGHVIVDDVENPKCLVWGVANTSALLNKKMFQIPVIFVSPEYRGDGKLIKELMQEVEISATILGCNMITGASWHYGDTSDKSQRMWKKSGLEKMETMYQKEI